MCHTTFNMTLKITRGNQGRCFYFRGSFGYLAIIGFTKNLKNVFL
jgi:hypothetical protein